MAIFHSFLYVYQRVSIPADSSDQIGIENMEGSQPRGIHGIHQEIQIARKLLCLTGGMLSIIGFYQDVDDVANHKTNIMVWILGDMTSY